MGVRPVAGRLPGNVLLEYCPFGRLGVMNNGCLRNSTLGLAAIYQLRYRLGTV